VGRNGEILTTKRRNNTEPDKKGVGWKAEHPLGNTSEKNHGGKKKRKICKAEQNWFAMGDQKEPTLKGGSGVTQTRLEAEREKEMEGVNRRVVQWDQTAQPEGFKPNHVEHISDFKTVPNDSKVK